jgi:predicted metal-binding membrane protein
MNALLARYRLPKPAVLGAIALAWTLAVIASRTGSAQGLHHDELLVGGPPAWAAVGLFILSWQVMIAAMMLPSSLPLIAMFERAATAQSRPRAARLSFIGGYAIVWTAFGLLAFAGDAVLHNVVERVAWLDAHPQVIAGGVLIGAGLFQFTPLRDRCLDVCRHPGAFLLRFYRSGVGGAFELGVRHGLFCLGCCWALMLVAFAVGVADLAWMAVFTALMVFEKTGRGGDRGVVPIGIGLVSIGLGALIVPSAVSLG